MVSQSCPNCGNPVRPGAKFCNRCGQALIPAQPAPVPHTVLSGPEVPPPASPPAEPPPAYSPPPSPPPQAVFTPSPTSAPEPSSIVTLIRQPRVWLGLAIVALIVVLCLGAVLIGGDVLSSFKTVGNAQKTAVKKVATEISTHIPSIPGLSTVIPSIGTMDVGSLATALPLPIPAPDSTQSPLTIPGLNVEIPHLTDQEEIDIGEEAAAEFESKNTLSTDTMLIERVQRIGNQIVPQQPRKNIPFTFKVVDSDEINAFALPGGFIYVNRGMIETVKNDDELAGVIGHEIAHVALRHGAELIERLATAQAAIDVMSTASPDFGSIYQDQNTQLAVDAVAQIVVNGWGRGNELDADQFGTIYMAHAGFRAQAVLDLFSRFEAEESGQPSDPISQLLATHPPFKERIARVEQTIKDNNL
jgi:hypothetical protein